MASEIFIDTMFVVALVNRNDEYHHQAYEQSNKYRNVRFVTTEAVLLEIGNALSRNFKQQAIRIIDDFSSSNDVQVVSLNSTLFAQGFECYRAHADKTWSLVDCISFEVMRMRGLADVLTIDKHFQQAGFNRLMID